MKINADLQVSVEGFLRFADYFFDGLFTDWAVLDHINESQNQVRSTKRQIEDVVDQLNEMLAETEAERVRLKEQLDELIVKVRV